MLATSQDIDSSTSQLAVGQRRTAKSTPTLFVKTLGELSLHLDGQAIRVIPGMVRTLEMIAYLLEHKRCTLLDLQRDVFAHKHPIDARSHIHVIRSFMLKHLHGLSMPFDLPSRTYSLEHPRLLVQWDVTEVRRGINFNRRSGLEHALKQYGGKFLTKSESQWVLKLRSSLETEILCDGLRRLEVLQAQSSHRDCLKLARGLLEIDPLNAAVLLALLRSMAALEGSASAQLELNRVREMFKQDSRKWPVALAGLRHSLA
jgi:two-component SAPR family response regulator